MSYTQTTTLSLFKPDFGHVGWRELYNSNFDTIDARFGVASFTSGSVIFADGSGKLSQDNANLQYPGNAGLILGRNLSAQNHGILRLFRSGVEKWRIGLDAGDRGSLMQGGGDAPALTVGGSGEIYLPAIGTTASAANVFVNNGSSPVNQVLRSTSSRKYKTDIAPVSRDDFEKLFALRPITYRSLAEADDHNRQWFGFVAEEVADIEPRLVHFSGDEPDGMQYDRLTVLLVGAVQLLEKRMQELER